MSRDGIDPSRLSAVTLRPLADISVWPRLSRPLRGRERRHSSIDGTVDRASTCCAGGELAQDLIRASGEAARAGVARMFSNDAVVGQQVVCCNRVTACTGSSALRDNVLEHARSHIGGGLLNED